MIEEKQENNPENNPIKWQNLSPEEASEAVFGGFCHTVNNALMGLLNHESQSPGPIQELLRVLPLDFESPPPPAGESPEEAIRETAKKIKARIEKKLREEEIENWLNRVLNEIYGIFEGEEPELSELSIIKKAVKNLIGLVEEKPINPQAPLERSGNQPPIFNFKEDLIIEDGKN